MMPEEKGADHELEEEEPGESQRKKLLIERKEVEINELYRDLEAKDVSIRDLEDQVSKLRRDRDAERKAAKNAEAMSKMKEGEQNDKIRKLTDMVDDRGDGWNRAIDYQKQLKEKALELSESLQSQNMEMKDKLDALREELDELKVQNGALHDAQDEAELGEALAKELAEQHSEAAIGFEMISQTLEPIMARLGQDFTAENVLKYVEDLQDKAQAKSIRRDPSNLSIQSSDSGIIVPKTRSGGTVTRKASIADELKDLDQEGMESGDEDNRIAGIPEEDENILQDSPELPNGQPKDEHDDTLPVPPPTSNGTIICDPITTRDENSKQEDIKSHLLTGIANQQMISNPRDSINKDNKHQDNVLDVLPPNKTSGQFTDRKSSASPTIASKKAEQDMVMNSSTPPESMKKKPEQAADKGLPTSTGQRNGKPVRSPGGFLKNRYLIRNATIFEALQRTPWWTNSIFMLMFLMWALSIFSNWHERRLWLDANNTYDMMNHYRPAALDSFTGVGGALYG